MPRSLEASISLSIHHEHNRADPHRACGLAEAKEPHSDKSIAWFDTGVIERKVVGWRPGDAMRSPRESTVSFGTVVVRKS